MRAIDYLRQVKDIKSKIKLRQEQLMSMTYISAVSYDHESGNGDNNANEKKILKRMEIEKQIDDLINAYNSKINEIVSVLETLRSPEGEILYNRYINSYSLNKTARLANYSVSQTKRYIYFGLRHLDKILDDEPQ